MKKWIIISTGMFFIWNLSMVSISYAKGGGTGKSQIRHEAKGIWRGNYSPDDLAKWEKKLEKFRSKKRWKEVSLAHNVVGVLHFYGGDFDKAIDHLNKALQINRKNSFEERAARDLHWIGIVQRRKGSLGDAFKSFQESLLIAKSQDMRGMVGKNLRKIGRILIEKGRFQDSMDHLKQVLQIAEEMQDERLMMTFLKHLGGLYKRQGNDEKARKYFEGSLEIARELDDRKWIASNLNGLGDICSRGEDYACAVKNYQQSLALYEVLSNNIGFTKTLKKMGKVHLKMKKSEQALQFFRKSYERARSIGLKTDIASASQGIANAYGKMGKLDKALERIEEAIAIYREVDIPDALQQSYHNKGSYLEQKGEISRAEKNYKASVKILETLREDVAGGDEEMLLFVEKRGQVYYRLVALLLKRGKVAEALKYIERSQLKKLRDQFDQLRPNLSNRKEEEARKREKKLRDEIEEARTRLIEEKSKAKESQDAQKIAQLEKRLSGKREEYIEYINGLREKFPDLASLLAIQPDTLIDLQSLLPSQVAIVQYLILEEQLYLFVVTNKSLSYKEVKVSQADLEGKIDYLRSLLMNPQIPLNMGPLEVKTFKPKDEGRAGLFEMFVKPFFKASEELHHLLIKPVEKELSRFTVLGIIPNGKLHLLPFQALGEKDSEGGFRFLLEDKALFQLNSQSILKFAQKWAKEIGDEESLIAFGNPDNSLKYAEKEIEMIKRKFSKSKAYVREEASEDKVKRGLNGFDILHLATHGKMKGNIMESYILLAQSSDGSEDGKLFLREIWGLPLRGYQLVTLSSCETATGKAASGDIMLSLETAFLRAGTPTILATLWEVDDEATGILMKSFYDNLKRQGRAEALRAAQAALLRNSRYVYPYYWAPFILVGDWR